MKDRPRGRARTAPAPASSEQRHPAAATAQRQPAGLARRARTPPPAPIPGPAEDFGRDKSPLGDKLKEKVEQLSAPADSSTNRIPFSLRAKNLDTSSTPAEMEARMSEVRYQIQVLKTVLTILSDELKALEESKTATDRKSRDPNSIVAVRGGKLGDFGTHFGLRRELFWPVRKCRMAQKRRIVAEICADRSHAGKRRVLGTLHRRDRDGVAIQTETLA